MPRSVLRSKVNRKIVSSVGGRSWSSGVVSRVGVIREVGEQGRSLEGKHLSRGHCEHLQLIWKD